MVPPPNIHLTAAIPGFLGGLFTGQIAIALLIGFGVGLIWLVLQMRFGTTLNSRMTLPADQIGRRERRPHQSVTHYSNGPFGSL